MTLQYIIWFLLPIAQGAFNIEIETSPHDPDEALMYAGEEISLLNDRDRQLFGLSDEAIKEGFTMILDGKIPNYMWVKDPTGFNNMYSTKGWTPVQRVLRPINGRVSEKKEKPTVVFKQYFRNRSTVNEAKYTAGLSQTVEHSVSTTWSSEQQISSEIEMKCSIGFAEFSTSMTFSNTFGEEVSKSKDISLSAATSLEVTLKPNTSGLAIVKASRGTMKVDVEYWYLMEGCATAGYKEKRGTKYHVKYYCAPITRILNAKSLPNHFKFVVTFEIGFFSNVEAIFEDVPNKK
nr:venom protein U-MPTX.8-Mc13 [Megalopyge crispata]